MKNVEKKYYNLEFYRIFFTIFVCVNHIKIYRFVNHAYLAVEFFFMVSGFMLLQSYKNKKRTPSEYLISRLKKLYPDYFFALIVYVFYLGIKTLIYSNFGEIKVILTKMIPEVFLVQNIGIWGEGNNYPLWYLAVLIWGGFFLYCLLFKYEYFTIHIFSPIFILGYYSLHFATSVSIESWNIIFCFSGPLMRGIADMCIGFLIYKIWEMLKEKEYISRIGIILKVVGLLGVMICFFSIPYYDKYILIFMPILIIGILASKRKNILLNKISPYCYSMYINQAFIINVTYPLVIFNKLYIVLFFIYLFFYSVFTKHIVTIIINRYKRTKEKN